MTDRKTKALKLALEALELNCSSQTESPATKAMAALREALAEQPAQHCGYPYCGCNSKAWCKLERMAENARELGLDYEPAQQQEPVAWMWKDGTVTTDPDRADGTWTPLYTSPQPSKPWVGLTDEEQTQVAWSCGSMSADWLEFAEAIEAKLKDKNT